MNIFRKDTAYLIPGILGALFILYGNAQHVPQGYYVIGSLALLITAIYYKLIYFIALELILIAGHSSIMLNLGGNAQIALPILLCLQLMFFYIMIGNDNNTFILIGIVGIALIALGFSYQNQWVFFFGGFFISVYAYYSVYTGSYPSLIWAILNTLFSGLAIFKILFQMD